MGRNKQTETEKRLFQDIGKRISQLFEKYDPSASNYDLYKIIYGEEPTTKDNGKNKISALRNGRNITLPVLMAISNRYHVSIDWLVYGNTSTDSPAQTTRKALTAISKFAQIEVNVQPMVKEYNSKFACTRTPYRMNIEITPKIYEEYNENYECDCIEGIYEPCEWNYYMDIENYSLAWFLHDWYSIFKSPITDNNKNIEYDNLLDKIDKHKKSILYWCGINAPLCHVPNMDREKNSFLSLSDYTPPKIAF